MLRTIGLLALFASLSVAAPVRVQDVYDIKLKKSGKGEAFTQLRHETEASTFKLEDSAGKPLIEKKTTKTVEEEFKETVLEKEKGKRASKLRREYRKAISKSDGKDAQLAYDGKTVLIEKKANNYHFTIEGGEELKGGDAASLDNSFNNPGLTDSERDVLEKAFLPKKPVRLNETWKFDPSEIVKSLEKSFIGSLPVDKSKMKGECKLLRVYKKDGRQFGAFDIDLDLPLKGRLAVAKEIDATVQEGSKMHFLAKYDGCIDGTSSDGVMEGTMEIDLVATYQSSGQELKMTLRGSHKEKQSETDLSKK